MKINKKLSLKKKDVAVLNENDMRNVKGGDDISQGLPLCSLAPSQCNGLCATMDNCTNSQLCGTYNCTNVAECYYTTFRCE